jgi:hypothetical protein
MFPSPIPRGRGWVGVYHINSVIPDSIGNLVFVFADIHGIADPAPI